MFTVADHKTEDQMKLIIPPRLFIASASEEKKAELFWTHRFNKYRALKATELASEVIQITPELAEWLITYRNSHNRPVRKTRVETFRRIIESGRWQLLSQGISFRKDGTLNNGQHRLHAIMAAGRAVPVMCVFGESDNAFGVIDTQSPRSAGDCISIEGIPAGAGLAASARIVMSFNAKARNGLFDNSDVIEFTHSNPDFTELEPRSVTNQARAKFKRCSFGGIHAAYYLIAKNTVRDAGEVSRFWDHLINGAPAKSSIHLLRDAFLRGEMRGGQAGGLRVAVCIIIAWNAWVKKRTPRKIDWNRSDPLPVVE